LGKTPRGQKGGTSIKVLDILITTTVTLSLTKRKKKKKKTHNTMSNKETKNTQRMTKPFGHCHLTPNRNYKMKNQKPASNTKTFTPHLRLSFQLAFIVVKNLLGSNNIHKTNMVHISNDSS